MMYLQEELIWNKKKRRLASREEIAKLINDGDIFVNYFIHGGDTGSEVWVDVDNIDFTIKSPPELDTEDNRD